MPGGSRSGRRYDAWPLLSTPNVSWVSETADVFSDIGNPCSPLRRICRSESVVEKPAARDGRRLVRTLRRVLQSVGGAVVRVVVRLRDERVGDGDDRVQRDVAVRAGALVAPDQRADAGRLAEIAAQAREVREGRLVVAHLRDEPDG